METIYKIKVGISSCLLGKKVRYDGSHKLDKYITKTLGQYFDWVPVCPEVEYGLPVPREALHLVGDPISPRLVTVHTGIDHTSGMLKWAEKKIKELEREDLCGFIFKSKSPSSGIWGVKVYTPSGVLSKKGTGIFAGIFTKHFPFIPVIDNEKLHNPVLRENFIEKVFVYKRWKDFLKKGGLKKDLIEFHTDHKLLLLSHSPKHLQSLGKLVANSKRYKIQDLISKYIKLLMEGLSLIATVKKNTNVLFHIAGYFKKHLSPVEKNELVKVIEDYNKGYLPLIVPIVLIRHYIYIFDEPYLKRQQYINSHPVELMLRNHS